MNVNLMNHQKDGIDFILDNGGVGALYWEVGCGKTLGGLGVFSKLREKNPDLKMFIICPLSLIEKAWMDEIKKYTAFKALNINKNEISDGYDIYIANYERFLSDKSLADILSLIQKHRWLCVIDESARLKNNQSKTVKTILRIRSLFRHRVILSGTPAPNLETEYWAQMTFLKDGIFHKNFYAFRNIYFSMRRGNDIVPGMVVSRLNVHDLFKKGFKYFLTQDNQRKLLERMKPHCHVVRKADCLDLPEQIDQFRAFRLSDDQRKIYNQMKHECIAQIINERTDSAFIVSKIALTKMMKLRQIISGFAIDDTGTTQKISANAKLREFESMIDELSDSQAIIWCNFKQEILDVSSVVGGRACFMHGDVSQEDRETAVDDFRSGRKQFLVANPASAGHGLTFTNCSVQIFYSIDFSYEKYEQARGRTHRYGQKNACVYIHLLGDDTIDAQIMDVLKKKKSIDDAVKEFANV